MIADPAGFIRANTRLIAVPLCPEIRLYTADEATALWAKTEAALDGINLPPPFWAFPWAGGQALARFILDRPALVRGRRVLDVASGSGLVAIAAAKSGAAAVTANDLDPMAAVAAALNGVENDVALCTHAGDLVGADGEWDVVLAGDIAYQADMAAHIFPWLEGLRRRGAAVFIGDPGRSYLPPILERVMRYQVPVSRALEDADVKATDVWTFAGDHAAVQPPSIDRFAPVMAAAASEQR